MKESKNYAVFILSHGRPDNVITYNTLRKRGYDGSIYIIVDDQDKSVNRYKANYGAEVIVFSKKDYAGKFDIMDNFGGDRVIVYARNACYDIARNLGLDYFFEYEDDYIEFSYRYCDKDALKGSLIKNINIVLESMIKCLDETKSVTMAFAQGGDFIGGAKAWMSYPAKRKAMNTFVFKVQKDKNQDTIFVGRMNDDVNTYLSLGKVGKLFFQTRNISINQVQTQANTGGNTEAYKLFGTYVKSFYSVMIAPSCCKIGMMGITDMRIHHSITWKNAVPKIIREIK